MRLKSFRVFAWLLLPGLALINSQSVYAIAGSAIGGEPPICQACCACGSCSCATCACSNCSCGSCTCAHKEPSGQIPISITEGNLRESYEVSHLRSEFGATINFSLHYNSYNADNSRAAISTVMGYGWTHSYNIFLFSQGVHMFRMDGDGRVAKYTRGAGSTFTAAPGYFETLVQTSATTFTLTTKDKTIFTFQLINTPFSVGETVYRLTSIVDRNNNVTSLAYVNGNLRSITDTYGRSLTLVHNNQNKLISVSDPLMRTTTLEYDSTGSQLLKITDPENKSIQYNYNSLHQLTGKADKDGRVFSYLYENLKPVAVVDGAGNYLFRLTNSQNWATAANELALNQLRVYIPATTTQTDGRGNFWYYEYDSNGYITRVTAREAINPLRRDEDKNVLPTLWPRIRGHSTFCIYDPATLLVASTMDAEGRTTSYQYDDIGNRIRMTNALGQSTAYTYEPVFSRMTSMTDPNGRLTQYVYDSRGNHTREIDPLLNTHDWTYDSHGNVLTTKDENGNLTQYVYDSHGNRMMTTEAGGAPAQRITFMTYDVVGNRLSHTDANAHTTTYTYDRLDRLTSETDPFERDTQTFYDGMGSRTQVIDREGNSTFYQYDLRRRLVKTTDALGHATTATYDGNNNRISMTDKNGFITNYEYDLYNRPARTTDALHNRTTHLYDEVGNLLAETDANNHTTRYEYDALNRRTKMIDALGVATLYEYDMVGFGDCAACTGPTLGSHLITKQTDCNGKVIYFKYDGLDRPILEIHKEGDTADVIDPSDAVARYAYDANSNRISVTEPNGNIMTFNYDALDRLFKQTNAAGEMTTMTYDGLDNVITQTDPNLSVVTNTYDSLNRLTQVGDLTGRVASYTYKNERNPVRESDGNGNTIRYEYDAVYRVIKITDATGGQMQHQYDPMGNLTRVTDRAGRITTFTYDAVHRRTSMTDALGHTTRYEYDGVGNLLKMIDAKPTPAITQYEYDGLNRLIKETNPDPPPNARTFSYDCAGNLTTRTDQKGQTTTYNYNDLYHLLKRDYPTSADDNMTYDLSGRMLSAERGGWLVTFNYDGANRLTQSIQNGKSVNYVHDIAGRTRRLTYPGGRSITEQMDFRDRITQINDLASPPIVQYSYDPGNRVMSRAYRNGTMASYTYNANNWVMSLEHARGITRIAGFSHDYDKEGNMLFEEKRHDPARSEAYQYDVSYRLINYKVGQLVGATVPAPLTQTSFTLDEVHNWKDKVTNGVPEIRQHNAVNEITSIAGVPITHDDNGNLMEDQLYRYAYDEENRLIRVTRKSDKQVVGQYRYDALGRRVAKVANPSGTPTETRYFYDDDLIIEEQSATGVSRATYVYGNDIDEVLTMDRGGQTYYYHQNTLLSVAAVTNSAGIVIERYRYDAFGSVTITDGVGNLLGGSAIGNPWMFTGRQFDEETGLYNYRTRYFDSAKGRFISRDSIGSWGDGENLGNGYAYASNNPVSFSDYDGTKKTKAERKAARAKRRAEGKAWWQQALKPFIILIKYPLFIYRVMVVFATDFMYGVDPLKIAMQKPFYGKYCGQEADGFERTTNLNGTFSPKPLDDLDECCADHDPHAKKTSVYVSFTQEEREANVRLCKCAQDAVCPGDGSVGIMMGNHSSKEARSCRAARANIQTIFCRVRGL